MAGRRILYAVPVSDQLEAFWVLVKTAFAEPIEANLLYKNETEHVIEVPGTKQRIRGKTAYNADTLRGDYADLIIFDEWQLMAEDAWELVGAPMLLDNNGDAVFIYTPPSLHSRLKQSVKTKAQDPQHAAKMFKKFEMDTTGRYAAFHWTSHDNPFISKTALDEITQDMTSLAIRMEILAEDTEEAPGALWTREMIEPYRLLQAPELSRIVVAIDPSATTTGNEAGIITAGKAGEKGYILSDDSMEGSPLSWATAAITAFHKFKADRIVAESNNGGEMVETVIHQVDPTVPVKLVHASRGKQTRAEPISAMYEKHRIHHVGKFEALEDEQCLWIPGGPSPNRMDACVWALTELLITGKSEGGSKVSLGITTGPEGEAEGEKKEMELPEEFKWIKKY